MRVCVFAAFADVSICVLSALQNVREDSFEQYNAENQEERDREGLSAKAHLFRDGNANVLVMNTFGSYLYSAFKSGESDYKWMLFNYDLPISSYIDSHQLQLRSKKQKKKSRFRLKQRRTGILSGTATIGDRVRVCNRAQLR